MAGADPGTHEAVDTLTAPIPAAFPCARSAAAAAFVLGHRRRLLIGQPSVPSPAALTIAGSADRPMFHHPNRQCPPPSMPESLPRPLAAYVAGCGYSRGWCNGTEGATATGTSRRRADGAKRRPHKCRASGAFGSISWDRRTCPVDAAPRGSRTVAGDRPTTPKRCRAFRPPWFPCIFAAAALLRSKPFCVFPPFLRHALLQNPARTTGAARRLSASESRRNAPYRAVLFWPEQSQRQNQQTVIVLGFDVGFASAWVDDRVTVAEPQTTNPVKRPVNDHPQEFVPRRLFRYGDCVPVVLVRSHPAVMCRGVHVCQGRRCRDCLAALNSRHESRLLGRQFRHDYPPPSQPP